MEKAKLSVIQFFAMMFMFEMGTSLVVSYGISAKKDAWLAILLVFLYVTVISVEELRTSHTDIHGNKHLSF